MRLLRRLSIGLVVAGVTGGLVTALGGGPRPAWVPQAPVRARERPPAAQAPAEPPPPPRPTRTVRLLVVGEAGPEPAALVRVLDPDRGEGCYRPLSEAALADASGLATLAVVDPAPSDAVVEVARMDDRGFRHGFASFAEAEAAGSVRLPRGAAFRVRMLGLPADRQPRFVDLHFLAPYAECAPDFADLPWHPSEDGGVFECRPGWRSLRLRLSAEGEGLVPHVPSDHVLRVLVPEPPPGFLLAEAAASCGSLRDAAAGDLRVPEGGQCELTHRWRAAPTWRVTVVGPQGRPLEGALVSAGLRRADGSASLLGPGERTDAAGEVTIALWTGEHLPRWVPQTWVTVVTAPGMRTRVADTPGGWDPAPARFALEAGDEARFAVEGRVLHASGRPAAGLPLRLVSLEPWNGHQALPDLLALTGPDGAFRFEVPENWRPALEPGAGLSVRIDQDRLEQQPRDAFWRMRWPDLPRMVPEPRRVALPPREGTARADLVLGGP